MYVSFHLVLLFLSNPCIDGHRADPSTEKPQEILMFLKAFILSLLFYSATAVQKPFVWYTFYLPLHVA